MKDTKKLKIRITKCYLVEVTDAEGYEIESDYAFGTRKDAEIIGERLKREVLERQDEEV